MLSPDLAIPPTPRGDALRIGVILRELSEAASSGDGSLRAGLADREQLLREVDQALLAEGGQLEDPASFVRRLNGLMLGLSGA